VLLLAYSPVAELLVNTGKDDFYKFLDTEKDDSPVTCSLDEYNGHSCLDNQSIQPVPVFQGNYIFSFIHSFSPKIQYQFIQFAFTPGSPDIWDPPRPA
jgi:hypothetical protein